MRPPEGPKELPPGLPLRTRSGRLAPSTRTADLAPSTLLCVDSAGIAPAKARSRARRASGVTALLLLSPFGAWLLALADYLPTEASVLCAFVGSLAAGVALLEQCQEMRVIRCSMTHITARTWTGQRSVDLTRIRDVRLLTTFHYGGAYHAVLVRDQHGVRLGLTSVRTKRALVRALRNAPGDAQNRPRISSAARAHLGLGASRTHTMHTVTSFLALTISICLYNGLVLKLAGL